MGAAAEGGASERLVRVAQGGDAESIAEVVRGAHPHVRRFAEHLCASPQDAEDAAREALIVLYRKIGSLRAGVLAVPHRPARMPAPRPRRAPRHLARRRRPALNPGTPTSEKPLMEKEVRRARNRLPELVLENTEGQAVRVADHRGEGAVLLYFSRSTACPVCARHVQDLVGRRGTPHEVVGLGRRLFGALQRSGTVLVAAAGIVRPAHAATVPTASYDRAGIAAALRALA